MCLPLNWRDDPLVQLEQRLEPWLRSVPVFICKSAMGRKTDLSDWTQEAVEMAADLDCGFDSLLVPAGFPLHGGDRATCGRAANAVRSQASDMISLRAGDQAHAAQCLYRFEQTLAPRMDAALDAVRRVFISGVLDRQAGHAIAAHAQTLSSDSRDLPLKWSKPALVSAG